MAKEIYSRYECAMSYHIEPVQYTGRGSTFQRDTQRDNEILIKEYIRTQKMVLSIYPEREFYSTLFKYKTINISCSSITGESPVIDNQGVLYPCSDRLNNETKSIGHISAGGIKISRESFFKEEYDKLKKTECGRCKFFSLCGGGCFSTFKRDSQGELLAEGKVKCELLKEYWRMAFEQLCQNKEFLELNLIFQETIGNWDIYLINSKP